LQHLSRIAIVAVLAAFLMRPAVLAQETPASANAEPIAVAAFPWLDGGPAPESPDAYTWQALVLCALAESGRFTSCGAEAYARAWRDARQPLSRLSDTELMKAWQASEAAVAVVGKLSRSDDGNVGGAQLAVLKGSSRSVLGGGIDWGEPIAAGDDLEARVMDALARALGQPAMGPRLAHHVARVTPSARSALAAALARLDEAAGSPEAAGEAVNALSPLVDDLPALGAARGAVEHICRSALAARDDLVSAVLYLGFAHLAVGDLDQALGACTRALNMDPGSRDAYNLMGLAYEGRNSLDEAEQAFARASKDGEGPAIAAYNHARIRERRGDRAAADAEYARVAQRTDDPRAAALAHLALAGPLLDAGNAQGALEHLDAAVGLTPALAPGHYNRGLALQQLGRLDEAVASYVESVRLEPGNASAHNNLGVAYYRLDRVPEAIAAYRRALELDPSFYAVRRNLAVAHEKAQDWPAALECWQQYLEGAVADRQKGGRVSEDELVLARQHVEQIRALQEQAAAPPG